MSHPTTHPLAGQTVYLRVNRRDPTLGLAVTGAQFTVQDWWDRVAGRSWNATQLNLTQLRPTMHYAIRVAYCDLPIDDDVVYGTIGEVDYLIHNSEIAF